MWKQLIFFFLFCLLSKPEIEKEDMAVFLWAEIHSFIWEVIFLDSNFDEHRFLRFLTKMKKPWFWMWYSEKLFFFGFKPKYSSIFLNFPKYISAIRNIPTAAIFKEEYSQIKKNANLLEKYSRMVIRKRIWSNIK